MCFSLWNAREQVAAKKDHLWEPLELPAWWSKDKTDSGGNSFTKHWHRLPGEVVDAPSLETTSLQGCARTAITLTLPNAGVIWAKPPVHLQKEILFCN